MIAISGIFNEFYKTLHLQLKKRKKHELNLFKII